MTKKTSFYAFLFGSMLTVTAIAQPPGGFSGGPPGGMQFGGGPPGGPPGGMSFGGRGDRSGGDRGDRGSGGFDPSSFLTRMDANGNGMLDPEEAQGPARFMLDRMARDNPNIDITKPIPMSTLTEAFQRMRSGGSSSSGSPWGGGDEEFIMTPEKSSLVPGFSTKVTVIPVPGFGVSGETKNVPVEESDLREAESRLRSYDKNNDKMLDESELKEWRSSDPPLNYDRNKDGKLSLQELAVRYARRRTVKPDPEQARRDQANASRKRDKKDGAEEKKEKPSPFEKTASYRTTDKEGHPLRPTGLPEWFIRNDIDYDNQVAMSEFNKKWDQDTIDDFLRFDSNRDGLITSKEALAAVKKGYIPGSSSSVASSADTSASTSSAPPVMAKPADAGGTVAASKPSGSPANDAMRKFAEGRMKKSDTDRNGSLSPDEFKESDFGAVDTNKDGRIDVDEYIVYRSKR